MIAAIGLKVSEAFRRTAPDPFVLAVLLTAVTFGLVLMLTKMTGAEAVNAWAGPNGVWGLLGFGMQMCLILVTGHALATSPPVARVLSWLAGMPRNAGGAVALVAGVTAGLGVLNWGLGLIAGAIMARRVGVAMEKRGVAVHYPLLAAAGYVGMMVWHGGFSGTAPLKVTDAKQIADIFGPDAPFEPISLWGTVLSPMNLFVTGGLLVIAPVLMGLMCPKGGLAKGASVYGVTEESEETPSALEDSGISHANTRERVPREPKPIVVRVLEDSPLVTAVLVSLIAVWAFRYYWPAVGGDGLRPPSGVLSLTPDTVNLTVLGLGLLLHGTPMRYVRAVEEAARGCAGIILQFPLYAGIMGLMAASGLTAMMASAMAGSAGQTTMPLWTFLSAGVVNLFVPSGGGQWAVQGPIAMQAAAEAGVDPAKMVMAVAYGDELTNMLQPFWALPLLAITGVKARDIVGYTAILMLVAAVWIGVGLLVF